MEDCGVTKDDLLAIGMSDRVIYGVMTLSRFKDETYDQFIDRICMSHDASKTRRFTRQLRPF